MREIPSSWIQVRFGEVNRFISRTLNPANTPDERFELYSVPSFPSGQPELQIGRAIGSTKQLVQPSDVLVCKINPRINRVWQVMPYQQGVRQIASSEWIVMRAPEMESRFLRYFFSCPKFRELICKDVTGVGGSLTRAQPKRVATFPVPVAPKNEQKRIADKLDAVVSRVDACRDRLDRVPTILKRFRQAVLAAATTGKLTEEWRGKHGVSDEWVDSDVQSIAQVGTGSTPLRSNAAFFASTGTPWITSAATAQPVVLAAEEFVTDAAIEAHRLKTFPVGTLLVAMYGEGKTRGQVSELGIKATINQACAAVMVDEKQAMRQFIKLALQANYLEMRELAEGGNQPNLNLSKIKEFPLRLPPMEEQVEIVQRVETLFAYADNLDARYGAARNQVERLTPALLAKAFRGELVPQDPNDEPALVLMERIRAARETTPTKSKKVEIGRGAKMTKVTAQSVKDLIRQLPDDRFTFDDLRTRASIDYETLKEIVFGLLSEAQPTVKQVFDTKTKSMRFVRVS